MRKALNFDLDTKKYEENTDFCRDFMFGYYSDTDDRMWKKRDCCFG